ncbi:MAG: hypothetical protein EXQ98_01575 [Alphaproteobacteria bacterium]|nr:hypothetical protein [Alphaproteobacteria bacterium]
MALAAVGVLSGAPAAVAVETLNEKVQLQAAMQQYIDAQSIDGRFLALDQKSGEVRGLHLTTAHPEIMRMGNNFVLCFDFKDDQGKTANVDFYMARKDDSYVVFHTVLGDHVMLKGLMKDGKISRME